MTCRERQPEVIVDFIFEEGLFFIAIKNIGDSPAYDVSVVFDKKFSGVEGTKSVSVLPLFRNISFLAPQKEIKTFLDSSASYFARRQPTKIRATISFRDNSGAAHKSVVKHDLEIYRDIGYIKTSRAKVESPDLDEC
jgi:hypothetical protein